MAGKIKGITITLGADVQPLKKALEDVNKKSRDLQSELRQVERLLKLDPGNTDLLAQKQKLLAEAVENSREKLNRLKNAQEQVNEQFAKGEISKEQYRAFQREVAKAEQELKGFERQLNETAKASETFEDKLNKALEDVNKKSKDLQSELGQVERLLKLDPKNTELLAQKQKLLAEAVENSREKLDRLKTAQEQVNEQFRKGEINEEQYRAFQREVVKAEQELEKFEKQLRETGLTAEKVGQKLKDAGQKMTDIGKDLSMKVTAPIVAAGGAAFKMAADLQDALGATDQIFGKASDSVKKWADELESYYGIAEGEALEYANMMGTLLMNIGGLTEEEAARQAQILVQLAGDLTAMFGGETSSAIQALTGALKGNTAMLDNYGIACNDALIKTKALEMGIWDGKGQMDLATKQAATLALIMEQTGAAQGQAAREAEGASGSLRSLTTEIKNLATDIGETLLPVITPFIQRLKDIVEAFGELSPGAQKVIIAIAGIAAVIGPLLLIFGPLISAIGTLVTGLGAMSAALAGGATLVSALSAGFPALGAALTVLTGPIGIAIAAIAALTAGGLALNSYLKQSSIEVDLWGSEVSEKTQEAVGGFLKLNDEATVALNQLAWSGQAVSEEMANSIIATFDEMGNQVLTNMQEDHAQQLSEMQAFFAQSAALTDEEEAKILAGMEEHQQQEQQRVKDNQAKIQEILNQAKEEKRAITDSERAIINQIQKEMTEQAVKYMSESELEQKVIMERLKSEASKISAVQAAEVVKNSKEQKDKVISEAEQQYNETLAQIIKLRDEAGTITAEQADALIKEAIRQKEETILNAEEMHARIIEEAQAQAGEHIKLVDWETGEVLNKWQVFKKDVGKTWDDIKEKSAETWDKIKTKAGEIWVAIEDAFSSVVDVVESAVSDMLSAGKNIVEGIWNGIKSLGPWLKEKVESFIKENIPDAIAKLLKIKSPSQVMIEFGRYVAEGLAQGMEEGTSEVAKKAQQMAQAISNAVQKMTGELSNALNLSNARLELQKELLGDNAEEYEKLALELEKLNNEKENLIGRIDVLTAAYETAKKELGENNEATKQYAYELEMAQIELQKMEVSIRKTSVAIEEQKKKAIEAARRQAQELRNLADEVTNVEKKYREDLAAAAEEYQKKVQEVNNKLIEDERRVTEEYEKAVEARAKSLRDFVGLFDAVTKKEISGEQLLKNLRGQVEAFENWQENIADLAAKGVDEGLIEELRQMGPKAGPEIAALNTLTDEQLKEYVALWKRKNEEARAEAINQLQQQRIEMQQKLMEIRQAANEQLELYRAEWEKKNAEIRKNAEEEMKRIEEKFQSIAKAGTTYGVQLVANFTAGMESQFDRLRSTLEEMARIVDSYMPHSPAKRGPLSRIMEWGPALVGSLSEGIKKSMPQLEAAMRSLASVPASALARGNTVSNYYNTSDNRVINITVQDGEDLLRTLHRLGVRIP